MAIIEVLNETFVDIGNTGISVNIYQEQAIGITIIGNGVFKSADPIYEVSAKSTNAMYVSGIVVEPGGLVSVGANGDVGAEFNGKLLTQNAAVVIPEIFKSDKQLQSEEPTPEPEPDLQDPSQDGKPTTGTVILLNSGDNDPFVDQSVQSYPVTNDGVVLQTQRKKFGIGSADYGTDTSVATCLKWGPLLLDTVDLNDTSFTIEFYVRFDSLADRTMRLFDVGDDQGNSSYHLDLTLDEAGSDTLKFGWYDDLTDDREITMILTERPFTVKTWHAFTYVYNSARGQFAFWVDGDRKGFVDASVFTDPEWSGVITLPLNNTDVYGDPYIGQGGHLGPNQPSGFPIGNDNFTGLLDNYRFTHGQALYDSRGYTMSLYTFPWPAPRANPPAPDPAP